VRLCVRLFTHVISITTVTPYGLLQWQLYLILLRGLKFFLEHSASAPVPNPGCSNMEWESIYLDGFYCSNITSGIRQSLIFRVIRQVCGNEMAHNLIFSVSLMTHKLSVFHWSYDLWFEWGWQTSQQRATSDTMMKMHILCVIFEVKIVELPKAKLVFSVLKWHSSSHSS